MGAGSILVSLGLLAIVTTYIARPFRLATATPADLDESIELWVAQLKAGQQPEQPASFCDQCGRKLEADARFCPGCGKPVRGQA